MALCGCITGTQEVTAGEYVYRHTYTAFGFENANKVSLTTDIFVIKTPDGGISAKINAGNNIEEIKAQRIEIERILKSLVSAGILVP